MLIGYVRVSTNDQNTDLQRNALNCAGCELIFEDKIKVNGRWAYLYFGPSTAGAALSIFISPPVVTAKLHTGFWVKSSTT